MAKMIAKTPLTKSQKKMVIVRLLPSNLTKTELVNSLGMPKGAIGSKYCVTYFFDELDLSVQFEGEISTGKW